MDKPFAAVICALNSKYVHSSLAPWCLLAGVEAYCENDISAEVVEGTINESVVDIAERILAKSPRVVGFCCYIWNIAATKKLARLIKDRLPDATIIFGGPEVSYNAEVILLEEAAVEYVVSGEGEKPFALLLNAVYRGGEAGNIPGVCRRADGEIVVVPPNTPTGEPPSPYGKKYFDALNGRIAYLETSRGCAYSCAFCLSGRCGGVRFFDTERAKKELLLLSNSGARTIKLVDRTFNINRGRAAELFYFIIQNYGNAIPNGVCFHFEIAGDLLDLETIRLLGAAPPGAIRLEIGLQSMNPKTLAAVNRKTDVKRLESNIRSIVSLGNLHVHIDLIAGLPFEDFKSFAQSFNIAYGLRPDMLQLGFLKLLHGAPMRENPRQYPCRYSEEPPYEVTETPWLSREELLHLSRTEDALERLFNSGRFKRTLRYLLKAGGASPFALFCRFGEYAAGKGTEKIPLDGYTALVFEYFSRQSGIDRSVLRDAMVCDRLATNSSGRLPPVLRVMDPALKAAAKGLTESDETRPQKGVRRGYALLYSERCLVYVDYRDKNPLTGEYPLSRLPLE